MDDSRREELRERIRKLLAVAKDAGAFSGEADNAMRLAAKLMAELGVTEEEILKVSEEELRSEPIYRAGYRWRDLLAMSAADLFGVFVSSDFMPGHGNHRQLVFHGPPEAIDAAKQFYEWLIRQVTYWYKHFADKETEILKLGRWRKNFRISAAIRIRNRVEELLRDTTITREKEPGTALVVIDITKAKQANIKQRLEERMGARFTAGKKRKLRIITDPTAIIAGDLAGRTIKLRPDVDTKTGKVSLIKHAKPDSLRDVLEALAPEKFQVIRDQLGSVGLTPAMAADYFRSYNIKLEDVKARWPELFEEMEEVDD